MVSQKVKSLPWSVISAVNNEAVLQSCLLSSPDIQSASAVILQKGFTSAAAAYNAGIEKAPTDVLVLCHQDVYLPAGWIGKIQKALESLSQQDPHWAVAGLWGGAVVGTFTGHLYCAGLMRVLGQPSDDATEVTSLDEFLLILRKSSGVRFDESLKGFHMYGTDICLEAKKRGLKSYAISAFCVHNTNGYRMLPLDFWGSYFFLRRKWKSELPITTSCTKITSGCWPLVWWNMDRMAQLLLRRHHPGKRVPDPKRLYEDLVRSGRVTVAAP
jgi:hypothetical protein